MPVVECDGALVKRPWYTREITGRLRVDERGLSHDGSLVVPRDHVALALFRPREKLAAAVDFYDARGRIVGEIHADDEHARAIVLAFATDDARAMSFAARSRIPSGCGVIVVLGVAFLMASLLYGAAIDHLDVARVVARLVAPLCAAAALFVAVAQVKARVTVAADGVRVGWLGVGRFVAWRDVVGMNVDGGTLTLLAKSGRSLAVRARLDAFGGSHAEYFAMIERMRRARDACARAAAAAEITALERAGSTVEAWVERLVALGNAHGYRDAAIAEAELVALLESPASPPALRGAAAVALGATGDRGARARIAAVAERTACPELRRIATAASCDADRHALVGAMSKLVKRANA